MARWQRNLAELGTVSATKPLALWWSFRVRDARFHRPQGRARAATFDRRNFRPEWRSVAYSQYTPWFPAFPGFYCPILDPPFWPVTGARGRGISITPLGGLIIAAEELVAPWEINGAIFAPFSRDSARRGGRRRFPLLHSPCATLPFATLATKVDP